MIEPDMLVVLLDHGFNRNPFFNVHLIAFTMDAVYAWRV
jgi:hypothetical protein